MKHFLAAALAAMTLLSAHAAAAGEKTVKLAVENMYCNSCPFIVKKSLTSVQGVDKVVVSFKDKTAVVTFDDSQTTLLALTTATTSAGYPSSLSE